jgi:hypothetical protein
LLTTLHDKERHIHHYVNLKLYLKLGMKLKQIHRDIKFNQSLWLKQDIALNMRMLTRLLTVLRKTSTRAYD